jgi:hypothetical protein
MVWRLGLGWERRFVCAELVWRLRRCWNWCWCGFWRWELFWQGSFAGSWRLRSYHGIELPLPYRTTTKTSRLKKRQLRRDTYNEYPPLLTDCCAASQQRNHTPQTTHIYSTTVRTLYMECLSILTLQQALATLTIPPDIPTHTPAPHPPTHISALNHASTRHLFFPPLFLRSPRLSGKDLLTPRSRQHTDPMRTKRYV